MGRSGVRASRVTLAHVAERAGVSVTTASFVLSGRTDMRISTATSDRVREAARVLSYVRAPRALRSAVAPAAGMPVVGFVTDTIASDQYSGEMIRGAISAAAEQGHGVVTAETEGDRPLETAAVLDLVTHGVKHFVYAAAATRAVRVPQVLRDLETVLLNCTDTESGAAAVVPDEQAAGTCAVEALVDAGHSSGIWLVGEVSGVPYAGRVRHAAITAALGARGLGLARHVPCSWWPPDARTATAAALADAGEGSGRRTRRPTAIIAMNDRVALGVYQAAGAAGLRIPRDVSVVSFDNSDLAWWLTPGLSSIGLPYFEMGRRAVEVLLRPGRASVVDLLPMPLHDRESVAAPRRGGRG